MSPSLEESSIEPRGPRHTETLFPVVYEELRRMAAQVMRRLPVGQTLQPTVLVHEAYLRLIKASGNSWDNRAHFFVAAGEAMRRILIDQARKRRTQRRGGGWTRETLERVQVATETEPDLVLQIDEALEQLAVEHPEKADLAKLRFFAGFSVEEAGEAMGLAPRTVKRHWAFARAWLFEALTAKE